MWPISVIWMFLWIVIQTVLAVLCIWKDESVRWYVFGSKTRADLADEYSLWTTQSRSRFAFADALKKECNEKMRGDNNDQKDFNDHWFEMNKDNSVIVMNGRLTTPRNVYIEYGTSQRQEDNDVWVRKCFDTIDRECEWHIKVVDITDFRFRNEEAYARRRATTPVFTSRLYRGITPSNDPSEHDLDNEIADFLLVGSLWDYIKYIVMNPRYASYNLIGKIHS